MVQCAFLEQRDQKRRVILRRDQVEVTDAAVAYQRQRHDRGVAGQLRQDRCRELQPLVEIALDLVKLVVDHAPLVGRKLDRSHQVTNVVAVALVRRDAARRGVGMPKVPLCGNRSHFVANRGWTQTGTVFSHDGVRPNRDGRLDVLVHDPGEDRLLAFAEDIVHRAGALSTL